MMYFPFEKPKAAIKPIEVKPHTDPPLPKPAAMVKNLATSAYQVMAKALKGEKTFNMEQEANRRLEICKTCEFFRLADYRCSRCGCYMKTKTYLKAAHCPIFKF